MISRLNRQGRKDDRGAYLMKQRANHNIVQQCLFLCLLLLPLSLYANDAAITDEQFFTLQSGTNLRSFGGSEVRQLLFRKKGNGAKFGKKQARQYCQLKKSSQVQWALTDLETGKILSESDNAGEVFFGASVAKIFVAAALLDKQNGELSREQLLLMTRMIVRSSNPAWKELQRQCGKGSDDSGRQAVHAFIQKMGYENLRGFQGWMRQEDGSRLHGNELNALAVAHFLYDTYHNRYPGAEILWKIMHATRTGRKKINKYCPGNIYIAGKTGTYHGSNESKNTIKHAGIKAHNHVTVFDIGGKYYSLSVFTNTGRDEDVAVLGGGLMREFLGVDKPVSCTGGAMLSCNFPADQRKKETPPYTAKSGSRPCPKPGISSVKLR
jgi:hypothetical protein